jgi:hypothetical protein
MKTKILFIGFLSLIGISTFAQIEVPPGTTRTFTVSNPQNATTFNWSFTNTVGTAITAGPTGTAGNTSVTFGSNPLDAGTISVIPVSATSCLGETKTISVIVKANMTYSVTVNSSDASICPLTGNQPTGGDVNANLTITGATAGSSVTIAYTTDGGLTSKSLAMTAPTASVIFDSNFNTVGPKTITITSIKVGTLASTANQNINTTVTPIPTVDDIQ